MIDKNKDNEVYILGSPKGDKPKPSKVRIWIFATLGLLVLAGIILYAVWPENEEVPEYYFEPEKATTHKQDITTVEYTTDTLNLQGRIEVSDDMSQAIPLTVYMPVNAQMSLSIGLPDKNDPAIIYVAQAADIRADNKKIVGDFVSLGRQIAWGQTKKGFCAVIGNQITIDVGEQTHLVQQSIDAEGYFFRQYPLVKDGVAIENNPENESIRRAIAIKDGHVVMIDCQSAITINHFSQTLANIGVSQAVYMVGSASYGWYRNEKGERVEFGIESRRLPRNTSYIVWRAD